MSLPSVGRAARRTFGLDEEGRRRICVVIKKLDDGNCQAQLRQAAGGNPIFYSRRAKAPSNAKREAESIFGAIDWQEPPDRLKAAEPGVSHIGYINYQW